MLSFLLLTILVVGTRGKQDLAPGVEGSLASGNFHADCTIIDKAKKLSRRLKLSSEILDDEQLEDALVKQKCRVEKRKRQTNTEDEVTKQKSGKLKKDQHAKHKLGYATNITTAFLKPTNTGKTAQPNITQSQTSDTNKTTEKQPFTLVSQEDTSEHVNSSLPLELQSCQYVDLSLLQTTCGPGFAANFALASTSLHQTIFFDVRSGHTILAVHAPPTWQCCRGKADRTESVGCRMGRQCQGL